MSCIIIPKEVRDQIEKEAVEGNELDPTRDAILENLQKMNSNQIPLTFENAAYLHNKNLGQMTQVRIKKSDLQQLLNLFESISSNCDKLIQNETNVKRMYNFKKEYDDIFIDDDDCMAKFNSLSEEEKKQLDLIGKK